MNKELILKSIKFLKESSPKRNFKQTIDLIINLKQLDIKTNRIDSFLTLKYSKGKPTRTCIFVDKQLELKAKGKFTTIITKEDFPNWTDKKKLKKLAKAHDFFIAQANLMTLIASTFGKTLGALGKMPNPKAGCVVPPEANLDILAERFQKMIRIVTKNEPIIKASVGSQDMPDDQITDNILTIYNQLVQILPQHEMNISSVLIKLSMSPPMNLTKLEKEGKQ